MHLALENVRLFINQDWLWQVIRPKLIFLFDWQSAEKGEGEKKAKYERQEGDSDVLQQLSNLAPTKYEKPL